jgi:dUTP pyrophosphatase
MPAGICRHFKGRFPGSDSSAMPLKIELKLLDPRLSGWGFPHYGSSLAAGLDLHACLDAPIVLRPQAPALLISAGFALRIGDPEWCALVLPRSGLGHREGLVLGNAVGLIDADYTGPCLISAWNRNPPEAGDSDPGIVIRPGDRIAQLVFAQIARPQFAVIGEFGEAGGRAQGGFGSTGIAAPPGGAPNACPNEAAQRNYPQREDAPRDNHDPPHQEAAVCDRGGAGHRL